MLDKKQMQEIQDLKLRGYTKSEINQHGTRAQSFQSSKMKRCAEIC